MKPLLIVVLHLSTAIAAHAQTTLPVANAARLRITAPMLPEPR